MIKFSEMGKGVGLEDADYIPYVDASETNPKKQNKTILYGDLKEDLKNTLQIDMLGLSIANGQIQQTITT